ncbi:M61 family peptidase [Parashewanella spongiae]|uniref:M61 family peptidase n=1 Tax=Parashewanella spongiae TaxID=342950 RepID=A0A3A6UNR7_9GAMM|nr:PDZ domain-containing protein [Parashewanella spongiae]MCL1076715.1 PDZ domain-containing protein [Parashewanella spongiae]RJY19460.1 M61 family peptidase [Parashewanella spongiae]
MIHYRVFPSNPNAHLLSVEIIIDDPNLDQQLWLPSWLPGSYMVRDFARNIIDIKATDQYLSPIILNQLDKQTWQALGEVNQLIVTYQVYAWDLSVRSAHLDSTHGFFNGSSVFLAVKGMESTPHQVTINKPKTKQFNDWKLATSMTRQSGEHFEFGSFVAENYDELIDHPVEMGNFTSATFEANGIPHDIVLTGKHNTDLKRLKADLKAICEYQLDLFGAPAPFERYLFLTTVLGNGFGGLEHRASTALMCSRTDLPFNGMTKMNKGYRTYLSLCSHEYFHNWNIKRIKPIEFSPYQLEQESYTKQLWAYEGITSYYDDMITYRAGTVDVQEYLNMLSETFTRVYRGKGRFIQSLKSSSFNAWTKFYKQDENAANAIVSYYTKGALFALFLDLTIRKETNNQKSLDDVMRLLWQNFGLKKQGTQENSHQEIIEQLLGRNCDDIFAYLDVTDDIPLTPLLNDVGIELRMRSNNGVKDIGGGDVQGFNIDFGAKFKPEPFGLKILSVINDSAAQKAGLSADDLLISANNLQVSSDLEQQIQHASISEKIQLHWFRRDELMTGFLQIEAAPLDTVSILISDKSKAKTWL